MAHYVVAKKHIEAPTFTKAGCRNIYASALSDHVDPHFTSYHIFDLLLYQYSEQLNLIHTLIISIHLCNCQESSEICLKMRKRKASSDLSRTKNKKPEVADSVTIIDGDGDLQIDLTDDRGNLQGLLVNRHVLRLASPVFAVMFAKDSPFEEYMNRVTNDNSVQVVNLKMMTSEPRVSLSTSYTFKVIGFHESCR